MRSFRQKVFVSYIALLVLFLTLMFPFVTNSVQQIVFRSMSDCANGLIRELVVAEDEAGIVQILKKQKKFLFYRVGVLDDQYRLLYDSHTKRLLGAPFFPLKFVTHPELEDALRQGTGYSEEYSHLLGQKLVYVAKRFDFHGKPYIVRLAFPFHYIQDLRNGFTLGFLFFGSVVLILFSLLAVIVLNHFSSPIREIIRSIRNYREGNLDTLPHITLSTTPKDEFSHLANTVNSLSRRVRAEIESVSEERNEREAILESLAEGVVAVDKDFCLSYINSTAFKLLGLTRDSVGESVYGKIPAKCLYLLDQCAKEKQLVTDEIELSEIGQKLHLNLVAIPRTAAGGALLVLHDCSVQHRMLEMRKAFIANASHELKTPITVIRGFAETVHDNPDLPQEKVQEVTSRIVGNCERMTTIIKNLLTLADVENLPSFRVHKHSLVDLVHVCAQAVQTVWKKATINISHEVDDVYDAYVDATLMEIAVTNLIENAAKYSELPAKIDISLTRLPEWVVLEVRDHGIGIPEDDLEHIFQRFYRVNKAHTTKVGGSGLGLSIVETIVQKHFGRIEVKSTLGQGTTFIVYLPVSLKNQLKCQEYTLCERDVSFVKSS